MDNVLRDKMKRVMDTAGRENVLLHASRLVSWDMYTVCPSNAMDAQGELIANLEKQAFLIRNDPKFCEDVRELYKNRNALNEQEKALVGYYYRKYLAEKNMTEETAFEYSKIENRAFADWSEAKDRNDFGIFKGALSDVIGINRDRVKRREKTDEDRKHFGNDYDYLLDRYDRGLTTQKLDECFGILKERLLRLIESIKKSEKIIRTDFLYRRVGEDHQRQAAVYLKDLMGLDPERSAFSTSKHGFTLRIDADDVRFTTGFIPDSFLSNVYTVIHESGHSLFELLTPGEDNDFFIYDNKTFGMHESISRFYENILGRSEAFISFIYPKLRQIFPEALYDVSEKELFEAVNFVCPTPVRVDADEVTYTLHILIRYEIEKEIFLNGVDVEELPALWNDKYEKYLGVKPGDDCEGILQDVQWTSDFGYFPAYTIGNFYGAMFYRKMRDELDVDALLRKGDLKTINEWMSRNVFKKADILDPADWIRDIAGCELSPLPYIEYLEEKYAGIYGLEDGLKRDLGREFDDYVERMTVIRKLSSPNISGFMDASQYSGSLKDNFEKIGFLAKKNKTAINNVISPLLDSGKELSLKEVSAIQKFSDDLVNSDELENLDVSMMSMLTGRLLKDSDSKQDDAYIVRQLDQQIVASYTLIYMTGRIFSDLSISRNFMEKGLEACAEMRKYLEHEKFLALPDYERGLVLTRARYENALYESAAGMTLELASSRLKVLRRALKIYEDEFYRNAAKDYDWDTYYFRTLENFGNIQDSLYELKLPKDQLEEIAEKQEMLLKLWESDPEHYEKLAHYGYIRGNYLRAACYAGHITAAQYRKEVEAIYDTRDDRAYDFDNLYLNLKLPFDYIYSFGKEHLSERDRCTLRTLYRNFCAYAFFMPNGGTLTALLEYFSGMLRHFIEEPGSISFKEMCLRSLAAFHPPTYVHSRMVALISRCIATHLLRYLPEVFGEYFISMSDDEILEYAYQSGLCHDFGKLPMIDTIFIYGRDLFDTEFRIIRQHSALGALMMEKYGSTRKYVDAARGHHRWYDDSRGYPEEFDTSLSPVKVIIDIVCVADCMDAATDSVGRSYNSGKNLDDFIGEIREGSGTRYAPYIAELFEHRDFYEDIVYLLSDGRQDIYKDTYLLLREVVEENG